MAHSVERTTSLLDRSDAESRRKKCLPRSRCAALRCAALSLIHCPRQSSDFAGTDWTAMLRTRPGLWEGCGLNHFRGRRPPAAAFGRRSRQKADCYDRQLMAGTVNQGRGPAVDGGRDSRAGQWSVSASSASWWSRHAPATERHPRERLLHPSEAVARLLNSPRDDLNDSLRDAIGSRLRQDDVRAARRGPALIFALRPAGSPGLS